MGVAWLTALALGLTPVGTAGVITELRGGEAPIRADQGSRPSVAAVVTPMVGVGARAAEGQIRLHYAPRFLWRQPNVAGADGALVLHQGELAMERRFSPLTRWDLGVQGAIGELDYLALRAALGAPQSAVPQSAELAQITGVTNLSVLTAPRWLHAWQLRATHRRPLGEAAAMVGTDSGIPAFIPRQTNAGVIYSVAHDLTHVDRLALQLDAAIWDYKDGLRMLTFSPDVRWRRRLGPFDELQLMAGVTLADRLRRAPTDASNRRWSASPLLGVSVLSRLVSTRAMALDGGVGGATSFYVDPVLGRGLPRVAFNARLGARFPRDWTAAAEVSFVTSLSRQPAAIVTSMGTIYPDETGFYATLPVRWRASENLTLEGGGRWLERGPHLSKSDWALRGRELWLYVMATVTFSVTPDGRHAPATGPAAPTGGR